MTEAMIELKNLHVSVNRASSRELEILHGLNLKIMPQDFITIIGTNGAGKSTLFNTIAGNLPVTSGEIYHRGQRVTRMSEEKRSSFIARVFQDPKLGTAPRMTVAENLLLAQKRGQRRTLHLRQLEKNLPAYQKLTALAGNDLEKRLQTATAGLSGGQRQTLSFLMATIKKPDLLLLDEHTAALDPQSSQRLLKLTDQKIQQDNLTALMITHHLQDALRYGNRLLVLKNGKIEKDFKQEEKKVLRLGDLYQFFASD